MINRVFLFSILLLLAKPVFAQSLEVGTLPKINIRQNLNGKWQLNYAWESRQLWLDKKDGLEAKYPAHYVLNDITVNAVRKIRLNYRLNAGFVLRFEENSFIHRYRQAISKVVRGRNYRIGHRLVTDQTFEAELDPEFRLRYRFTWERALNGLKVDKGEWYFKVNHEYLNSLQSSIYDLEFRIIPLLGKEINRLTKVEFGIDYRAQDFLRQSTTHVFWLNMNWYYSF